jgi:hypothetical protein
LNTAIRPRETFLVLPTILRSSDSRRGYKFITPVERFYNGESKFARLVGKQESGFRKNLLNPTLLVAGLAILVLFALNVGGWRDRIFRPRSAPIRSLAVLPLQNLSGSPEQEYFADGMTEALITELGKISALRVISRQSTIQYKITKSRPNRSQRTNVKQLEGSVSVSARCDARRRNVAVTRTSFLGRWLRESRATSWRWTTRWPLLCQVNPSPRHRRGASRARPR